MKFDSRFFRAMCGLLCLLLLLPLLPSCKKESTTQKNVPVLTAENDGSLTYSVVLDDALLQAHKKQRVDLFELLPGETTDAIAQKSPIAAKSVAREICFELPMTDAQGSSRLHRKYFAFFSDGTPLADAPCSLSNPENLAKSKEPFPHANRAKGLYAANEELSAYLHSAHTLVELSLSDLLSEANGNALSGSALEALPSILKADEQLRAASRAGMQITLTLTDSASASLDTVSLLIEILLTRYSADNVGTVSAVILREDPTTDTVSEPQRAAELLRFLHLSLRSRFANGQVYLASSGSAEAISAHVQAVNRATASDFSFGVALSPLPVTASMIKNGEKPERLSLADLQKTSDFLFRELGIAAPLALIDLEISAEDEDLQAALLTYTYRLALQCKFDLVFYRAQTDAKFGLFDENEAPRLAATAYRLADTAENAEGERLAQKLLPSDWEALERPRAERVAVVGVSNLGTTGDFGDRLFDFSSDKHPTFTTAGLGSDPVTVRSELWNTQVLTASLSSNGTPNGSGYRFLSKDSSFLQELHVISANLLPQTATEGSAVVTLCIDATATDGKAISYTSSISLNCNAWQTVSFHVRSFTSLMDSSKPCTVTLLMKPETNGESQDFALWLHSVNARRAEASSPAILITVLSIAAFGISAGTVIAIASILFGKRRKKIAKKTNKA